MDNQLIDQQPPHSDEAERAVLGGIFLKIRREELLLLPNELLLFHIALGSSSHIFLHLYRVKPGKAGKKIVYGIFRLLLISTTSECKCKAKRQ